MAVDDELELPADASSPFPFPFVTTAFSSPPTERAGEAAGGGGGGGASCCQAGILGTPLNPRGLEEKESGRARVERRGLSVASSVWREVRFDWRRVVCDWSIYRGKASDRSDGVRFLEGR